MGVAEYPCNPSEENIVGMAHLTLIFTKKKEKKINIKLKKKIHETIHAASKQKNL